MATTPGLVSVDSTKFVYDATNADATELIHFYGFKEKTLPFTPSFPLQNLMYQSLQSYGTALIKGDQELIVIGKSLAPVMLPLTDAIGAAIVATSGNKGYFSVSLTIDTSKAGGLGTVTIENSTVGTSKSDITNTALSNWVTKYTTADPIKGTYPAITMAQAISELTPILNTVLRKTVSGIGYNPVMVLDNRNDTLSFIAIDQSFAALRTALVGVHGGTSNPTIISGLITANSMYFPFFVA
jgi:hypothetical protein